MAWKAPKINWINADVVSTSDFDRIEQNIEHLRILLG